MIRLHSTALQLCRVYYSLHASSATCSSSVCTEVRVTAEMFVPVDNHLYLLIVLGCVHGQKHIGVELVGIKMQHIKA